MADSAVADYVSWTLIASAWECPRCRKMNAPHAPQCTCGPLAAPLPWPEASTPAPVAPVRPPWMQPWWEPYITCGGGHLDVGVAGGALDPALVLLTTADNGGCS